MPYNNNARAGSNMERHLKILVNRKRQRICIKYFFINISTINGLKLKLPVFHKELLESWYTYKNRNTTETKENILNKDIFGNKNITYKKQSFFKKTGQHQDFFT